MTFWFRRSGKSVRDTLLLQLQQNHNGITDELRSAMARNGIEISTHQIEHHLQRLAKNGLVTRQTFVVLTVAGYRAAAEVVRRRQR